MHIVRTIGQAFEVCHKINVEREKANNNEASSETPKNTPVSGDVKVDIEEKRKSWTQLLLTCGPTSVQSKQKDILR